MSPPTARNVCCNPIAAPLRARPAVSAVAVNERPFHESPKVAATIRAGTTIHGEPFNTIVKTATEPAMPRPTHRNGAILMWIRSDQRPRAIREMPPSTCVTASAAAATAVETPRWSCRNSTKKPSRLSCVVTKKVLATQMSQMRRSRSGRASDERSRVAGSTRIRTNATTEPTTDATARPRKAARRLKWCSRSGSATAPTAPPSGTAICRIPKASPRSSAANHCMTARPVAELTPAATPPATASAATSIANEEAYAAQTSAPAAAASPADMTIRSPMRSATSPQTSSVGTEPKKLAARTTPVCVSVSPKSRRIAGAIAGRPSPVMAYDACATTPAASTVQRYRLRGCAGVEVSQLLDLVRVRAVAVGSRDLQHGREVLHPGVREEHPQAVAHQPVADVVVAVAVRPEWRLRVVRVQRAQPVEPDALVNLLEAGVPRLWIGHVDTGDVEVTRVEADAEPLVPVERVEQDRELVDRAADRAARAGGVLHQQPGAVVAVLEHLSERRDGTIEPGLEAGAEMRADVDDDAVGVDLGRGRHRRAHRVDALSVDLVVRRGEVDEVQSVDKRGHVDLLALGSERLEVFRVVIREVPGARALDEELDAIGVHPFGLVERLLDPARTMSSEQHLSNLTACLSASAWRRARPGSSTSGTSARRSSTGCSRGTTTASSSCGSRTRTRVARSRLRRSRSRSRSAGSASTGTAT